MNFLDKLYNDKVLKDNQVEYKTRPTINGRLHIYHFCEGAGRFKLGENVGINSSIESNPVGGVCTCFVVKGDDGFIEIDDNAGMSNVTLGVKEKIFIGKDTNLGAGTKIFDNDFHSLYFESRVQDPDPDIKSAPVSIQDGAFIGGESIILKGVTIGEKAVVGAGSIVTKDIPAGELWAGNPASFVKKLYETP